MPTFELRILRSHVTLHTTTQIGSKKYPEQRTDTTEFIEDTLQFRQNGEWKNVPIENVWEERRTP